MEINLLLGDCLDVLPTMHPASVNLAILDLPYNISKASWDKWKKEEDYIKWVGEILIDTQRVLTDNGSLYFFHNDMEQIAVIMEWMRKNTKFVFKQFIVWNKRFEGAKNKGFLDGFVEVSGLRNYQQMAEYILFYTFQDETGLSRVYDNKDCFLNIKNYLRGERKSFANSKGVSLSIADKLLAEMTETSTIVRHYWGDAQWMIPTEEMYKKLQRTGFFCREYEDLRREYEDLRYTFSNQKSHHSVWNYEIAKANGHITPKPVDLIENIILHSSNIGDTVLDPTAGSGTTGVACKNTNRNFIGIEKEPEYFEIARKRIYD